jgi:hypothetical protein
MFESWGCLLVAPGASFGGPFLAKGRQFLEAAFSLRMRHNSWTTTVCEPGWRALYRRLNLLDCRVRVNSGIHAGLVLLKMIRQIIRVDVVEVSGCFFIGWLCRSACGSG